MQRNSLLSFEDEAVAYLKHTSGKTEEGCRLRARRIQHYTGWVPGLLSQYLTEKCVVEQTRRLLLKGVSDALHSDEVAEVLTAVAEGRLKYELSDALDSGATSEGKMARAAAWHHRCCMAAPSPT
ncbi:hypothetical protein SELMODRAFT_441813 [Selaginella moellendorffii]|uniref:Uncharacterized protein n=1 Tax=Selaginella moellendorffii TaxID=88036 RepID=D8RMS1_SELML|nr:hypothetical protein SELMODRAFT_441813 [Selaginella moellendorffii]